MPVKPTLPKRVCPKCHLTLGHDEVAYRVDERTIRNAEKMVLSTGDDDAILRFAELAQMGRHKGLHKWCAERIAHALRGETPSDLLVETLAQQTAAELCHHGPR